MKPEASPMNEPKTRQTDRELALLGKMNRQLLELSAEERGRIVDWLYSRHRSPEAKQ